MKKYLIILSIPLLFSCNTPRANYPCELVDDTSLIILNKWDIAGPITPINNDTTVNLLDKDQLSLFNLTEKEFFSNPYDVDKQISSDKRTFHHALDGVIDLRDIFNVSNQDTLLVNRATTYLYCNIPTEQDINCYLLVKPTFLFSVWLNGEKLPDSDIPEFNRFSLRLKTGNNYLMLKTIGFPEFLDIEALVCKKEALAQEYTKKQMGIIARPILGEKTDTLALDKLHQNLLDSTEHFWDFHDTKGNLVLRQSLIRDSIVYDVSTLNNNQSYLSTIRIGNNTLSQPILIGDPDEIYAKFNHLKELLDNNSYLRDQLNEMLYRLNVLLNHESRNEDWWWPLKIAHIAYEIENIFENREEPDLIEKHSWGVQFKTYRSEIDNNIQRYMLITPDTGAKMEKMPLVVVVRPFIENHHHFFTSPQVSRYWSLAHAKALANSYGFAIIMPEIRLYSNEDLIPFAESEILYTLNRIQKDYQIDPDRIYLQGNCSAGYRALRIATQHPDLFAAVGLYAPVYHSPFNNVWSNSLKPEDLLENLNQIPLFLHFDFKDTHSPYSLFKDFIKDCKTKKMDLTLSTKKHSGGDYNVFLVGEEAFSFFRDKRRNHENTNFNYSFKGGERTIHGNTASSIDNEVILNLDDKQTGISKTKKIIADLFAEPFLFVFNSSNNSDEYSALVESIKSEYADYLFSALPLVGCNEITESDLSNKNLFFIGDSFDNKAISDMLKLLTFSQNDRIGKRTISQTVHVNPINPQKLIVVYKSSDATPFKHRINFPWKNCLESDIYIKQ